MADLTELYKKQRAVAQEIDDALKAAKESGEVIVIDGKEYDSTMDFEGELPEPKDTDYFPTYRKDDNGDITGSGEITYKALIEKFGASATEILNQAILAGETSVENIQEALTAALVAIGQDNASGARGQAIAAINALYSTIAEAITSANSAWNSQVSSDKSAWASQVAADLQSLATALSNALDAIGGNDSEGARGNAISSIATALQNALASIGQSDTAGARGEAITAIQNALNTALASWQSQVSSDNTAFDNKVAQANTTIDQKVTTATTKANEASNSAALAKKWAENPEDVPVEGTGDNAEYSSKHWAKKAEANSQVPMATDTTAGKVYISNTADIAEGEANLANKVVNKQALHDALEDLRNDMKQTLPSPEVEYVKASAGDYGTFTLKTNYSSAFGNVKVVMTPSSADPSASDTEITVGGTTVSANDNWQITAIQTDPDSIYSDSLTAVIEVTDLKCQAPIYSYNEDTDTFSLSNRTNGATIRYTDNGDDVTESSTVYNSPVTVTETKTIKARAFKDGLLPSDTTTGEAITALVFAVQWNYGNSSPALTRLTPAADPLGVVTETIGSEPVPATTSQAGSSPFDSYKLFQQIKRRNFDANGAPSFWEDEPGFSVTSLDTLVWIPKFWVKVTDDASAQIRTYYLSTDQLAGFELHPGSGQYVGAYPTSNSKECKSGKTRQGSQSIVTMRTNAKTKGAGWGLIDIAQRNAIQFLYIIEYANWNSQNMIGSGPTSDYATGYSDVIDYHTGVGTSGVVKYRHIEGLWRSQYEWTDGLNVVNGQVCVSTDRDNYQSDVTTGYDILGTWTTQNQNIQKFKYFEDKQWLISIPEYSASSDYNTWVGDDGYIPGGTYVLGCGGDWSSNAYAGLFYFFASASSSYTNSSRGSRLSYKEPSAA